MSYDKNLECEHNVSMLRSTFLSRKRLNSLMAYHYFSTVYVFFLFRNDTVYITKSALPIIDFLKYTTISKHYYIVSRLMYTFLLTFMLVQDTISSVRKNMFI